MLWRGAAHAAVQISILPRLCRRQEAHEGNNATLQTHPGKRMRARVEWRRSRHSTSGTSRLLVDLLTPAKPTYAFRHNSCTALHVYELNIRCYKVSCIAVILTHQILATLNPTPSDSLWTSHRASGASNDASALIISWTHDAYKRGL